MNPIEPPADQEARDEQEEENDATQQITSLPNEVLLFIFSQLHPRHLLEVRTVCRRWRDLAMHPLLWSKVQVVPRRGSSQADPVLMRVALLLAPCVDTLVLDGYKTEAWSPNGKWGVLTTTRCAVRCLVMEVSDPILDEEIIRHQAELGRLRRLKLDFRWISLYDDDVRELIVGISGIETLQELKIIANRVASRAPPSLASAVSVDPPSSTGTPEGLTHLASDSDINGHLELLLTAHANSLQVVDVSECDVPTASLAELVNLRHLHCSFLPDMPLLMQCCSLTAVSLVDNGYHDDAEKLAAFEGVRTFLSLAAAQLTSVRLCGVGSAECVDLVRALGDTERPALQHLILSTEMEVRKKKTVSNLMSALQQLPLLQSVDMCRVPLAAPALLLGAVTPTTFPRLLRLSLSIRECSHAWLHRPEVESALQRNPHLHLVAHSSSGPCCSPSVSACAWCRMGCHPAFRTTRNSSEKLPEAVGFFSHSTHDDCGLSHDVKSTVWMKV